MTFRQLTLSMAFVVCTLSACTSNDADESPSNDSTVARDANSSANADSTVAFDPVKATLDSIPVRSPSGTPARFGWRSGHLVLRYSGGISGKREIFFDDWGMRERRIDSTEPAPGIPGPKQYTLLVSTKDRFTMIDLPQKTGWTMANDSYEHYLASDSSKKFSLGEMIFRSSGGARRPDEMLNGIKVGVLEMVQGGTSTKIWVRQGLVVKEQFKGRDGAGFSVEPVLMEFDIDVPESLFAIPPGIKLQERAKQGPPQGAPPQGQAPPAVLRPPSGQRVPMPGGGMPMPLPAPGGR